MTTKSPSRSAVRRLTAANAARVNGAVPPLPEAHQTYLDNFRPQSVTGARAATCRKGVVDVMSRAVHIKGAASFTKVCVDVSALACWADSRGMDLTWTALMNHDVIHEFTRSVTTGSDTHRSQRMRRLKNLASHLNPGLDAPPRPAPVGHRAVQDPYSAAEMARIRSAALNQPSPLVRRQLCLIVGVCRGAGAASDELRPMRGIDIRDCGADGLLATIGAPGSTRVVPVRRAWEDLVRIGIDGVADGDLLLGKLPNRRNIANAIVERATILGPNTPHIDAARLRTTWIAELMSEPIPVQVILDAAGLRSARILTDLLARMAPAIGGIEDLRGQS